MELYHQSIDRSHRQNGHCVTHFSPGPTFWMALCDSAKCHEFSNKNRPRKITGIMPIIPAISHALKINNISTNNILNARGRNNATNKICIVVRLLCRAEKRWTKQRDAQRGDIILWRVFSLPPSRLVIEWLLAEHSGPRNNCFLLLKFLDTCTHLHVQHTELKLVRE